MNPFQKHDISDFPDVFVPLSQATRNPSVVADHEQKVKIGSVSENPEKWDDEPRSPPDLSAYTVEGLRAEVDLGMLEIVIWISEPKLNISFRHRGFRT